MLSTKYIIAIVICVFVLIQMLLYSMVHMKRDTNKPFEDATSYFRLKFSMPDLSIYHMLPNCSSLSPTNSTNISSSYTVPVREIVYTYEELEARHDSTIHPGGHWFPSKCQSDQRIAIIVCYSNREEQLKIFLDHMHPFLQEQQLDYTIFVINQHEPKEFNRATLFNIGFIEARKLYPFTCFIFHDVDLLPMDSRNIYKCGNQPRHMAAAMDKFNYTLHFPQFLGGVVSFTTDYFIGANGGPNIYWGWGGEDDDMYLRVVKQLKKTVIRYPREIARYKMIRRNHVAASINVHRLQLLYLQYDFRLDGINTTRYKLHPVEFYKLFTLINVTLIEETFEQICARLKLTEKQLNLYIEKIAKDSKRRQSQKPKDNKVSLDFSSNLKKLQEVFDEFMKAPRTPEEFIKLNIILSEFMMPHRSSRHLESRPN